MNCDMTTDGGGWIELASIGSAGFSVSASTYTSGLGTITDTNRALACGALAGLDLAHITMRETMGAVRDYFRPTTGNSLCDMLASSTKHSWSNSPGGTFVVPAYNPGNFGGSALNWPIANVPGELRQYLAFWGGTSGTAGCCNTTNTTPEPASWGRTFVLHVREP